MEAVKQIFCGDNDFYPLIAKQNKSNKWELYGYTGTDDEGMSSHFGITIVIKGYMETDGTSKASYARRLFHQQEFEAIETENSTTGRTIIKVLQSGKWREIVFIQPPRVVGIEYSQTWEYSLLEPMRLVYVWGDEDESLESVLKRGAGIKTILIDLALTTTYDITEKSSNNIISLMEYFLKNGIDVNEKDEWGDTALHYSCRGGNINIIKLLLENGANINEKNKKGHTAWAYAKGECSIDIIKMLLAYGADINEESMGTTILEDACSENDFEMVKFLLEQGADTNGFEYPLQYISCEDWRDQFKILKLLASKNIDVNVTDEHGMTTLMHIASVQWYDFGLARGSFEDFVREQQGVIQLLLDKGGDINAKCNNGKSALHYVLDYTDSFEVSRKKHPYLLTKYLLERGADINASDKNGTTVLMLAIISDLKLVTKYIISQKVNINAKDNLGRTALVIARQWFSESVYEMLRKKLGGKDEHGETIVTFKELKNKVSENELQVLLGQLDVPCSFHEFKNQCRTINIPEMVQSELFYYIRYKRIDSDVIDQSFLEEFINYFHRKQ